MKKTLKLNTIYTFSILLTFLSCSEVEKSLNTSQSVDKICPVPKVESEFYSENSKNNEFLSELISKDSSSSRYANQIINYTVAQLYLSPHATTLNSHTLLYGKLRKREFFIRGNSIQKGDNAFIKSIEKLSQFAKRPFNIKARMKIVEATLPEHIYASKSLENFIQENQRELYTKRKLKKLFFRGAQGIRESELIRKIKYTILPTNTILKSRDNSFVTNHLFPGDQKRCAFDPSLEDANLIFLRKPEKTFNNTFVHYKDKDNFIIGITSTQPLIPEKNIGHLTSFHKVDNHSSMCILDNEKIITLSKVTYNDQVLNRLTKIVTMKDEPEEIMNTKRYIQLHNPKRIVSEVYGKPRNGLTDIQYHVPMLGKMNIFDIAKGKLKIYADPRNKRLTCN